MSLRFCLWLVLLLSLVVPVFGLGNVFLTTTSGATTTANELGNVRSVGFDWKNLVVSYCQPVTGGVVSQVLSANNVTRSVTYHNLSSTLCALTVNGQTDVDMLDNNTYVIAYESMDSGAGLGNHSYFEVRDLDGNLETKVAFFTNNTNYSSLSTNVAALDNETIVVTVFERNNVPTVNWYGLYYRNGTVKVPMTQLVNISGVAFGSGLAVNSIGLFADSLNTTRFVLGWYNQGLHTANAQVFDENGVNVSNVIVVDSNVSSSAYFGVEVGALDYDEFVVLWGDNTNYTWNWRRYNSSGVAIGSAVTVYDDTAGRDASLGVINNTHFAVTLTNPSNSTLLVYNKSRIVSDFNITLSPTTNKDHAPIHFKPSSSYRRAWCDGKFGVVYEHNTSTLGENDEGRYIPLNSDGTQWDSGCIGVNDAPLKPQLLSPNDWSQDHRSNGTIVLRANVYDPDGDALNVFFYDENNNLIDDLFGVSSGDVTVNYTGWADLVTHNFSVNVTDTVITVPSNNSNFHVDQYFNKYVFANFSALRFSRTVVMDNTTVVNVFLNNTGSNYVFNVYDVNGTEISGNVSITNEVNEYPRTTANSLQLDAKALNNDTFVVGSVTRNTSFYYGVKLDIYGLDGARKVPRINVTNLSTLIQPYVQIALLTNETFAVVFTESNNGITSTVNLSFKRYDYLGNQLGNKIVVDSNVTYLQGAVGLDNETLAITLMNLSGGVNYPLFYTIVQVDGTVDKSLTTWSPSLNYVYLGSYLTALDNETFIILAGSYYPYTLDGFNGYYYQVLDEAGNNITSVTNLLGYNLSTYAVGTQFYPVITAINSSRAVAKIAMNNTNASLGVFYDTSFDLYFIDSAGVVTASGYNMHNQTLSADNNYVNLFGFEHITNKSLCDNTEVFGATYLYTNTTYSSVTRTFYSDNATSWNGVCVPTGYGWDFPNATLSYPVNGSTICETNASLVATFYDADDTVNVTFEVDGMIHYWQDNVADGTTLIVNLTGLSAGHTYNWLVTVTDDVQNLTVGNFTFTVAGLIDVDLVAPLNDASVADSTPTFTFNYTDGCPLMTVNCTLYIDGFNDSIVTGVLANINQTVTGQPMSIGVHTWTVNCTDGYNTDQPMTWNVRITEQLLDWALAALLSVLVLPFFFAFAGYSLFPKDSSLLVLLRVGLYVISLFTLNFVSNLAVVIVSDINPDYTSLINTLANINTGIFYITLAISIIITWWYISDSTIQIIKNALKIK